MNARRSALAGGALLCVVLCACGGPGRRADNPADPSLVSSIFPSTPDPERAEAWATDPYDADIRFRGILIAQNARYGDEPRFVEIYRGALNDDDPAVQAAAVRGLARHGLPSDLPAILALIDLEAYTGTPDLLRWEIARAAQRVHNPQAVPVLIEMLRFEREERINVRTAAADALAQYPLREVGQALSSALEDRDLAVAVTARRSLTTLVGEDLGNTPGDWQPALAAAAFPDQQTYLYPAFRRGRLWYEWFLFWRPVPNEVASTPIGWSGDQSAPE